MIYCKIENGAVVNRASFAGSMPDGWAEPGAVWIADEAAQIGWAYDGKDFVPPPKPPEPPPPYTDINRSAFLFMMNKIGITEAAVEALIDKMPDGTPEQADAKTLALIVFRNQQTFARGNQLLQMLTAAAGLTSEAVDAAWRAAERIKW